MDGLVDGFKETTFRIRQREVSFGNFPALFLVHIFKFPAFPDCVGTLKISIYHYIFKLHTQCSIFLILFCFACMCPQVDTHTSLQTFRRPSSCQIGGKKCFYDIHCKWANFTEWTLWTWEVMLPLGCVNELCGPCNTLASSSYRSGLHAFRSC